MRILAKFLSLTWIFVWPITCSIITLNLTDSASQFISGINSNAININYTANIRKNSTLLFSVDSQGSKGKIKLSLCDPYQPANCSEVANPYESNTLLQSNMLFLLEIDPNSTYLIRTFLSDSKTKLFELPSKLIPNEGKAEFDIDTSSLGINFPDDALLILRIFNNPKNIQYTSVIHYQENQESIKGCVIDHFGIMECPIQKNRNYTLSIKNFGINSNFFIDYQLNEIPTLEANSDLIIQGIGNVYYPFKILNNMDSFLSISLPVDDKSQIFSFSKLNLEDQNLIIPSQQTHNSTVTSGILILQPLSSNFVSIISQQDFLFSLTSKVIDMIHVPLGREVLINNISNFPYVYFDTAINFVPKPFYLKLKLLDGSNLISNLTWFINRGSEKDKILIPYDNNYMFFSKDAFYLLIESPQVIYFTLKTARPGNFSFYLVEDLISDAIAKPLNKPFPYFWIIFGFVILELIIQSLILFILYLRDRIGRSFANNRVGQVQPEDGNRNPGPKSADEVKIEGLNELTLSQNQSKTPSKEEILCIICMDKKRNVIFSPCNHKITCVACAKKLYFETKKCPICRGDVQKLAYEKTIVP